MRTTPGKLRVGLCSAGVVLGLLVPSGVVSAGPCCGMDRSCTERPRGGLHRSWTRQDVG
jgi:hypothetical protein